MSDIENQLPEQEVPFVSFEAAMKRLEEIAGLLDGDASTLDEALKLYEEGIALIRTCDGMLNAAEQKIKILNPEIDR